jgi:pimeloyl-ACP methyl ester carboxylesterase
MGPSDGDHASRAGEDDALLRPAETQGRVECNGARIWYATCGSGPPVVLLHGALGSGEDWANQVPALIERGYRAILIDSRGQGRSTRDARPLTYELMAADVLAVMDALAIEKAAVVGWSDGAIIGLILAMKNPERIRRVFAFGANMDLSGLIPVSLSDPVVVALLDRAAKDYARLSETPDDFKQLSAAVFHMMATQPNYRAEDLATIRVAVAIVHAERDEFITREHAEYLARSIPGAQLIILRDVGHMALQQKPQAFNAALLAFLDAGERA